MGPASTLILGSTFRTGTREARDTRRAPSEAAAKPLASKETTPPVTKMNFGPKSSLPFPVLEPSSNVVDFALTIADFAVQSGIAQGAQHAGDVRSLRDAQRDDGVPAELGPRPADLRQQPLDRRARRGAGGQVQPGERRRAGLAHGPSGLARRPGCPQARR